MHHCEGCKFWKNEADVRLEWYKNLDKEQWAMWINTRNMREYLERQNDILEQISDRLEKLEEASSLNSTPISKQEFFGR